MIILFRNDNKDSPCPYITRLPCFAAGEYIIYIDNDDYWGDGHLQGIADEIGDLDWAYFNDWVYNGTDFIPRNCDIKRLGAMERRISVTASHWGSCGVIAVMLMTITSIRNF